jgi:Polyketide synthase dehydratase
VAAPRPQRVEVDVAITAPDGGRRHYSAVAEARPDAPTEPPPLAHLPPFPMDVETAYRDLLFHGPAFHRIVAVEGMDERGARALLRPSPPGDWLLDPMLIDGALQIQVIWARLHWEMTLLPSEIGTYRRVAPAADGDVRHELRIRPGARPPLCHADHWFYGPDGRLITTLGDVVGVGTRALNRLAAGAA